MKKIAFFIPRMAQGGAERTVVDQINGLSKRDFCCYLCTLEPEKQPSFWDEVDLPAERKIMCDFQSFFDLTAWERLIDWLKKEKIEIIYSNLFAASLVGRLAGFLAGVPRLIAVEQNVYINRSTSQRAVNFFLAFISEKIIAISRSVKDYLIEKEKISSRKIEIIYNGVDLERYRFDSDARQQLRSKLQLEDGQIAVLSVGRISRQKGYDILIETAREIKTRGVGYIRFFIAGMKNQNLFPELEKQVSESGLSEIVHFLGPRDDIGQLMSMADIFFMPSRWEGFGLVLVEAMAAGRPAVVSDIGPLKEVLDDGRFGLVGKSSSEFADLLIDLSQDEKKRRHWGMFALERAEEFSLQKNIQKVRSLFMER